MLFLSLYVLQILSDDSILMSTPSSGGSGFRSFSRSEASESLLSAGDESRCRCLCTQCGCLNVTALQRQVDQQRLEIQQLKEAVEKLKGSMRNTATTTAPGRHRDLSSQEIYGKLNTVECDDEGQIAKYSIQKSVMDKYLNKVGEGRPVMAKNFDGRNFLQTGERQESNVNGRYNKHPLDLLQMGAVREACFLLCHADPTDQEQLWKECIAKINRVNRDIDKPLRPPRR